MSHDNPQDKAVELLTSLLDRAGDGFIHNAEFQLASDLRVEVKMLIEYIVQACEQRIIRSRRAQ